MDKIKSILSPGSKKDDEAMYNTGSGQQATGASGKLTGEGSHFGTGGAGTDSAGYSLGKDTEGHGFSAAEPTGNTDSAGYAIATEPEALGTRDENNHVNPVPSEPDTGLGESTGAGQAVVGQTSTYSSHPLATGDKTSSVVDPSSSDANTFRRPEASSTGVGQNAAEIAARKAYNPSHDHVPGEYPSEESSNPYAASNLDPRVDSAGHAPVQESHIGRNAALGAGTGAAGLGAYEASESHEPASSSLTGTTNPTERSPAYGSASESRGIDSATPATASTPATATDDTPKKSMVGTVLGALGLGGGAAVAKHEHDKDAAVDSTPSTTTGVESYRTPSQSGPPPSHHRKESIPTTAYPSGSLDSVRPIAGPTGQSPTQSDSHVARDAAIGGGVLGAAGLGAHEYEKDKTPTGDTTFASGMAGSSSAAPNTSTVHDVVTGGNPQTSHPETSQSTGVTPSSGSGLAATAGTTGAVVPDAAGDGAHHYGRDAAIGGGALGAAGLGAHEYEKNTAPTTAPSGVTPSSQHYGNQPITSQSTKEFSNKVDPRTDVAGNANAGTGIGAVPITTSDQPEDKHLGRDAAVVGGGAAAAGYGEHELSKHDAEKAEKEHSKLQKSQTKQLEKEEKAHEKELKKEQKAEAKAEKKHDKELAKEEKKHEKAVAKEEKQQQQKVLDKEEKRHEEEGAAAVGTGAVGAGAYEAEKHHEDKSSQVPATTGTSGTHETDPYYNRHQVPESAITDQQTESHVGRDAAIGGTGAAGAYEAEKHHEDKSSQVPAATGTSGTHETDPYYNRHQVPDSAIADQRTESHVGRDAAIGGTGAAGAYEAEEPHPDPETLGTENRPFPRLAAADEIDRRVYGGSGDKKPSLFRRIFKRKKNVHTGESEDDENDYEDVPHDQHSAAGAPSSPATASKTAPHVEGEMIKPSYNPFKKEDPNVTAVDGRI